MTHFIRRKKADMLFILFFGRTKSCKGRKGNKRRQRTSPCSLLFHCFLKLSLLQKGDILVEYANERTARQTFNRGKGWYSRVVSALLSALNKWIPRARRNIAIRFLYFRHTPVLPHKVVPAFSPKFAMNSLCQGRRIQILFVVLSIRSLVWVFFVGVS